MGTHPIFESDFDCLTEVRITQNSSQHAARKKLQGSPRCRRSLFNQEEEGSQRAKPALRKATKELRNWPGHPTEAQERFERWREPRHHPGGEEEGAIGGDRP